jgi:hypothetical protein
MSQTRRGMIIETTLVEGGLVATSCWVRLKNVKGTRRTRRQVHPAIIGRQVRPSYDIYGSELPPHPNTTPTLQQDLQQYIVHT